MYSKLVFWGGNWAVGPDVNIPYGVTLNVDTEKCINLFLLAYKLSRYFSPSITGHHGTNSYL